MGGRGFTLVEMLVALVVLGLAMVAVNEGLRFSAKALGRVSGEAEAAASRTVGLSTIRRLIGDAYPLVLAGETDGEVDIVFEGSDDNLVFPAFLPGYVSQGGLYLIKVRIKNKGSGSVVELFRAPFDRVGSRPNLAGDEPSLLITSDQRLKFSYQSATDDSPSGAWTDERAYPDMIQLIEGRGKASSILTVPFPARATASCPSEPGLLCPLSEAFPQ
ncbi:MAG: prepilin-type N-terminal cleavage/methylation domain-containing protein [Pseudomonadota bacterium]